MAKWYLTRHGETSWNAEGRLQGHQDVTINDRGRRQAERLGDRFSNIKFDAAYTSDLIRCVETATLALKGTNAAVIKSPLLREQGFGYWEGLSYEQIEVREPKLYAEMMKSYESFTPPGGESFGYVGKRVRVFAEEAKARRIRGNILVVGHGGSLRALIMVLLDMPLMNGWRMKLDSCGLTVLEVGDKSVTLEMMNNTSHLKEST
ncbi:MAG: histidine phosphatase family protein [SAR202 cluster bacterium]|nr:histidine phosphatase family protein [SAR202 cluster bacterium]